MSYTDEQRELALTTMVAAAGDEHRALELLSKADPDTFGSLTLATLVGWRDLKYAKRYREIADEHGPELENELVRAFRNVAVRAAVIQTDALDVVEAGIKKLDAVEAARVARDLQHLSGQAVDKVLTLTGRPTEISEDRSLREIARGLMSQNLLLPVGPDGQVVDGTAVEDDDRAGD